MIGTTATATTTTFISLPNAAKMANICVRHFRRLTVGDALDEPVHPIPLQEFNSKYFFLRSDVEQWIRQFKTAGGKRKWTRRDLPGGAV